MKRLMALLVSIALIAALMGCSLTHSTVVSAPAMQTVSASASAVAPAARRVSAPLPSAEAPAADSASALPVLAGVGLILFGSVGMVLLKRL